MGPTAVQYAKDVALAEPRRNTSSRPRRAAAQNRPSGKRRQHAHDSRLVAASSSSIYPRPGTLAGRATTARRRGAKSRVNRTPIGRLSGSSRSSVGPGRGKPSDTNLIHARPRSVSFRQLPASANVHPTGTVRYRMLFPFRTFRYPANFAKSPTCVIEPGMGAWTIHTASPVGPLRPIQTLPLSRP